MNHTMTLGETLITLLLIVIAFLLYQIAKQLSYITGKRIKISLYNPYGNWKRRIKHKKTVEKLVN